MFVSTNPGFVKNVQYLIFQHLVTNIQLIQANIYRTVVSGLGAVSPSSPKISSFVATNTSAKLSQCLIKNIKWFHVFT